jgi:hypothetical protein
MSTSPWMQMEGESDQAYAAFVEFRDLGPGRTADAAWRAKGTKEGPSGPPRALRAPGSWKRWRAQYHWDARSEAFDDHVQDGLEKKLDEALEAHADEWAARQIESRQKDWELGAELRQLVQESLQKIKKAVRNTDQVPDLSSLVKAADLATKLQRQSAGVAAEVTTETVATLPKPVSEMSIDELEKYAQASRTTH